MNGIEIQGLSKRFGEVQALNNVDLHLEPHKIYGLLGRNGAGKTTLLNIIANRLFPDVGSVRLDGAIATENDAVQGQIYMMSELTLYPEGMHVKQAIRWTEAFYPSFDREFALALAEEFGLNLKKKVGKLSTGYRSIFKAILALSVGTPVVLFDEPVLGLDANHRDLFYRRLLERYSEKPCTIIISTHLIEEVANIVEDVVIIHAGNIICHETKDALMRRGYAVSGQTALVEAYTQGKMVIGREQMGGLCCAYLLGEVTEPLPAGLERSALDLQKLFVQLTNTQGGTQL